LLHGEQQHVVQALAARFSRGRATIRRRLKRLDSANRAATSSIDAVNRNAEPA
jgi:hypothetical protein